MGFLDSILKRNKEIEFMFDLDMFSDKTKKVYMKKLAIDICANFLGKTISQSEFRIKNGKETVKDELYYRLNVRPNKNMTASMFWQTIIYKLIYDNECLIIQADDGDLLIADDFYHNKYAVYEDIFTNVVVDDYEFKRSFRMENVLYLPYNNRSLAPLINELFTDYGDLFGSILKGQKRKNQIRSTVSIDMTGANTEKSRTQLQDFINKIYEAIEKKDVAVVPQQKGFEYKEHTAERTSGGQSVDEVNKVTGGFLDQVAIAIGIPPSLIRGEVAEIDEHLKSYMTFTVNSLVKKIQDESNIKFIEKEDFLNGKLIEVRKVATKDIFEFATSVDKLRSSGVMNGHELRDELNLERVDDPILDEYVITKNYGSLEGGEDE